MTAVEGEHIDNNNHSGVKYTYPTTIYGAKYNLVQGEILEWRFSEGYNAEALPKNLLKLYQKYAKKAKTI